MTQDRMASLAKALTLLETVYRDDHTNDKDETGSQTPFNLSAPITAEELETMKSLIDKNTTGEDWDDETS